MPTTATNRDVDRLGQAMLQFAGGIDMLATPDEVLDALHRVTSACNINVLGAGLFPGAGWGSERV